MTVIEWKLVVRNCSISFLIFVYIVTNSSSHSSALLVNLVFQYLSHKISKGSTTQLGKERTLLEEDRLYIDCFEEIASFQLYKGWLHHVTLEYDFAVVLIQELNMMTEVSVYHIDRGCTVVSTVSVYLSWSWVWLELAKREFISSNPPKPLKVFLWWYAMRTWRCWWGQPDLDLLCSASSSFSGCWWFG